MSVFFAGVPLGKRDAPMLADFNLRIIFEYLPLFLIGLRSTFFISAVSIFLALICGTIACACRISSIKLLKYPAIAYIEVIRSTPLLVQIYFLYFGLPTLGIRVPEIQTGIIALMLNSGAYIAEIIRAGITSVDDGQIEAGVASGLNYFQRMRFIILPEWGIQLKAFPAALLAMAIMGSAFICEIVDGVPVHDKATNLTKLRADIGFVFQQFHLYPHMTVLQNVMLAPVNVRKMSTSDAEKIAREKLTQVGLTDKAGAYPGQLSGGQQQRVAIARGLAMTPKIMLFDEPTSALDPEMIGEVLDVMVNLVSEGMTMCVVTHEMGFARKVADRVLFMDMGKIVETGKPDEFFDNPQTHRAADFISKILTH
jgi:His/Glu/Gln/Arg/opine family amino acid ABC transporter permease subunit